MKFSKATSALLIALSLPGCAPVVRGGPALALPPEVALSARVTSLTMSSDWMRANDDFAATFNEEMLSQLSRCARGSRPLHLRIYIEDYDRAGRIETLIDGEGVHRMKGIAELVDPARGGQVVGRYPLEVAVDAGGRVGGLVGDREMMVSRGFASALCDVAFRTKRPAPAPWSLRSGE